MKSKFSIAVLVFLVIAGNEALAAGSTKQLMLLTNLFTNLDLRVRPGADTNNATIVDVSIFIRSITNLDTKNMEMTTQLIFRMQWNDPRLVYEPMLKDKFIPVPKSLRNKMWMPDAFFSDEIASHSHDTLDKNEYLRIHSNGDVLYSTRISLTIMDLETFPFDHQICHLRLGSYGHTKDDLIFKWKDSDPVQLPTNLLLPRFILNQFTTDYCDSYTNTGPWSCAKLNLLFLRANGNYLLNYFAPSFFSVLIAWFSSFLHPSKSATSRTLFLLCTTLFICAVAKDSLKEVEGIYYNTSMHRWNAYMILLALWAILEFILVNYLANKESSEATVAEPSRFILFAKLLPRKLSEKMTSYKFHDWVEILHRILFIVVLLVIAFGFQGRTEDFPTLDGWDKMNG